MPAQQFVGLILEIKPAIAVGRCGWGAKHRFGAAPVDGRIEQLPDGMGGVDMTLGLIQVKLREVVGVDSVTFET